MVSSRLLLLLRRGILGPFTSLITLVFLACLPFLLSPPSASSAEYSSDAAAIGAAFFTHIFLHEVGHQVMAEESGADSPQMHFMSRKNGKFYPGRSTVKSIQPKSRLSYAGAGEAMASRTFEYALYSYHQKPTTYNKALMFFSCTDFLWYTLLANYVHPENDTYDPNMIREETGIGKEALLGVVLTKSLLNAYRVYNEDAKFMPMVTIDTRSVGLMVRYEF